MKYLEAEVEVKGASKQAERRATEQAKRWATEQATSDVTDRRSSIRSSERSPMPESRCNVLWAGARVVLADQSSMRRC